MRPRPAAVVALDIGGSSVKSGLVVAGRPAGAVAVTPLVESGPAEVLVESLATGVAAVAPDLAGTAPLAVAAAVPDPFDHAAGVSRMTHKFAGLHGRPLGPLIERAVGRPLEVRWCNDAAAAVAGEAHGGAGAGARAVLGVTLGTGLGAAVVRDGTVVERAGDVVVGDLWQALLPDGRRADRAFSAQALLAAVDDGDAARFGHDLGAFLAPVVRAVGAEMVLVGGGGAGSFDHVADAMRAVAGVPVERFRLGRWGALIGAVQLCWPDPGGRRSTPTGLVPDG